MNRDPSRILLPGGQPRRPILEPYIVTVQYSFRVDSPSPEMAENMTKVGISFNTKLAESLLAHGVQAVLFTKENVEALGFNMEEINSGRTTNTGGQQQDRGAGQDNQHPEREG